jgi:hypothetical protein
MIILNYFKIKIFYSFIIFIFSKLKRRFLGVRILGTTYQWRTKTWRTTGKWFLKSQPTLDILVAPLLFLHLDISPTGSVEGQVTRSSRRSLDPVRFVCGGWRSALSRVEVGSAAVGSFGVLQLGVWTTKGGDVPLLRLRWMKLKASGSGDHREYPQPKCHKVSVSSLTTVRFIGSESIFLCEGALPDLGMAYVCLFFRRFLSGGGERWWTIVRRGTNFFNGEILVLLLLGLVVQVCLTSMFVSDHMCNLQIVLWNIWLLKKKKS